MSTTDHAARIAEIEARLEAAHPANPQWVPMVGARESLARHSYADLRWAINELAVSLARVRELEATTGFVCMNCGSVDSFKVEYTHSLDGPDEFLACTNCGDTEIVEGVTKACA